MGNNLFLDAMSTEQKNDFASVKRNKEFAMRLISDLSTVFHTNHRVEDATHTCRIIMKASPNYNEYNAFRFHANKEKVTFSARVLSYYKRIGDLYERYKNGSAEAEANFLNKDKGEGFGHVKFNIEILPNDNVVLRDIIYLMELEKYKKRF